MNSFVRIVCCCPTAIAGTFALVLAQAPPVPPTASSPPNPEAIKRAEQILAESRTALGGDKLANLKTLVASGRTKRVRGNNLVPIEFEMLIELPDKYLRTDEFPAEDTDPTSFGFNGDALIQASPLPAGPMAGRATGPLQAPAAGPAPSAAAPRPGATMPPGGRGPAMDPRRARVMVVKQDYARMALGLFAASPAYPLTFSYAAMAEAPQGQADVLDGKGEGNFAVRLFISRQTHLPIMVTWNTPPTNVIVTIPGQPPPQTVAPGAVVVTGPPAPAPGAPKEETDKYAKDVLAIRSKAQGTPVEHRLYFGDYREVDGMRLPFRLRRAIATETTEETTFDRFRINGRIDARKFEVPK